MNIDMSSLGFTVMNNVYIDVVNEKSGEIIKHVEQHNKATRQMVSGILRFLCGHFTYTTRNKNPVYDTAKRYIPCYFSCGDGNVKLNVNTHKPEINTSNPQVPRTESSSWYEFVPYTSTKLEREFFTSTTTIGGIEYPTVNPKGSIRCAINSVSTTIDKDATGDMDSILFYCEAPPGYFNNAYDQSPIYITELGLFSGAIPGEEDLLAYVRLGNYTVTEEGVEKEKTNSLFVKPNDTVIIRWIVSIAAIGKDNVLRATNVENEQGTPILSDIVMIPDVPLIEIENYPTNN